MVEGLGEGLAAVRCSRWWSRPKSEENGSGWSYKGLEHTMKGLGDNWAHGEAMEALWGLGQGVGEVDFAGGESSSALSEKRKRGLQ